MRNKEIARITLDALIIALIAIASFVPYVGYIGVNNISITTIHVFVLLFAILFGMREGAIAGFFFGLFSLIRAVAMPSSPMDILFVNPLVSIMPRLIFGLLAGLTFDLIRRIENSKGLRIALAFIAMPILTLVHSFLTLSLLWLCYHDNELLSGAGYWILIGSIFTLNGLIETAIALVLVPPLAVGIYEGVKNIHTLLLKAGILYGKNKENNVSENN
jgi:uncharacterized membrane protein